MGIPGLTTFLSQYESKYSEIVYVRDCPLVIDGYNLMFTLYYGRQGPSRNGHYVGGDYIRFATEVREYFQHFKDCLITPIVIMDGAFEEEKMETIEKRYQALLSEVVKERVPGKTFAPTGLTDVFLEIIEEQKIQVFQTKLEADDTIAFIANKLSCPVLSSDSDFQIYPNLTSIPLNAVQFRRTILKSGIRGWTLSAKIVSLKKLCQKVFKFQDMRLIPLAALVLGNDRVPTTTFQNFMNTRTDKYDRIEYIFKWFASQPDYDRALRAMMESVKEFNRDEIHSLVLSIVDNYMGESGEVDIWNMVQTVEMRTTQKILLETKAKSKRPTFKFSVIHDHLNQNSAEVQGTHLQEPVPEVPIDNMVQIKNSAKKPENKIDVPGWFLLDHYKCRLPDQLLKIIINRIVLFYPQVEAPSLPSAHDLSLPILQVTAGILLGNRNSDTDKVALLTRSGTRTCKSLITPVTNLPNLAIPTIQDRDFGNGQNIIFETFELTFDEKELVLQWPVPCRFVIVTILYFLRKLSKPEGPAIAIGIIMSFLKTTFMSNGKLERAGACQGETASASIKNQAMTPPLDDFYRHFKSLKFIESDYKIGRVYHYSQYQCILSHGMALNNLLANPFKPPKFQVLDSYLVYNIMESVLNTFQGDAIGFLRTHCKADRISSIFEKLFEVSGQEFDTTPIEVIPVRSRTRKQKNTPVFDAELAGLDQFEALSVSVD